MSEGVALGLAVAQAVGAVVVGSALVVVRVGIVGNLEEVLAVLGVEAKLILGGLVANERRQSRCSELVAS